MRVLLVDDDRDLLDVTAYAMRREGFNVVVATDGLQALRLWQVNRPDVAVLDVRLPGMSGLELCAKMSKQGTTPVILLTGRHEEDQIVEGFRQGADDYVTKPFSPRQLAMRIRAVGRRVERSWEPDQLENLAVGDFQLDVEAHEVYRNGQPVRLTNIEFRLFYMLASNVNRVISADRLVDYAWQYNGGDKYLLKTHVSHIRSKLGITRSDQWDIQSVGVGYRLSSKQAIAEG